MTGEISSTREPISFDELVSVLQGYENDSASYARALLVNGVYEGRTTLTGDALAGWEEAHPKISAEDVEWLKRITEASQQEAASSLGLDSVEAVPPLVKAIRAEERRRDWSELGLAQGIFISPSHTWEHGNPYVLIDGIRTLAQLTGESYPVQVGDHPGLSAIGPDDSLEDVLGKLQEIGFDASMEPVFTKAHDLLADTTRLGHNPRASAAALACLRSFDP